MIELPRQETDTLERVLTAVVARREKLTGHQSEYPRDAELLDAELRYTMARVLAQRGDIKSKDMVAFAGDVGTYKAELAKALVAAKGGEISEKRAQVEEIVNQVDSVVSAHIPSRAP